MADRLAGLRSGPGIASLLPELGWDPPGLTASGEGPARREEVGGVAARGKGDSDWRGRRLQEGGVPGWDWRGGS